MAQLPNGAFDATQVEPQESFDPIPAGEYNVLIEDSEMKPTKSGNGEYLQITFSVLDGQYNGRKIWDRLNLLNPNQTAVDIANRTLSAICHATGVMNLTDSVQLHGKTLRVKVAVSQREGYDPSNEIKAYKAIGQGSATAPAHAPAPAPQQQTIAPPAAQPAPSAGSDVPPWKRGQAA